MVTPAIDDARDRDYPEHVPSDSEETHDGSSGSYTMQQKHVILLPALTIVTASLASDAAADEREHPFILWTKEEAVRIRSRVETEDWAKTAYEAMLKGVVRRRPGLQRLFRYSVMRDKAVGEAEKKSFLEMVKRGKVRAQYSTALQYDTLYELLDPQERQTVERAFRTYIRNAMASMAQRDYNRWNWLPNLGYPWYLSAHLMAVALRDTALAREIFTSHNGLKWYFDEYLSDLGFYNEEFGKMYNTPDAILLWCRACERLGMDEIGYGYRGRQGATARGHIESVLRLGMPRVDLGTERPHYPRLSLGDAKGSRNIPAYGFQHSLVGGFLEHRYAGRAQSRWRLGEWSWFEMAHAKWPDAGFGYFLAQRRGPRDPAYYPSLLFGLDPIDPQKVSPPAAPSGVYPGRGLVVLRAEEGPTYWESPAPAVGMRLATPYAHHVQDCFSLTGFYAYNRPLYVNRKHATNYSGVDPGFSNSSRSHSTVVVDFGEPKTIGQVLVRHHFSRLAKFAAARGQGIYEGVDQTRALVLTRDYLIDVFCLASDRPRSYLWIVHGLGHTCPDDPHRWTPTRDLVGYLFHLGHERSLPTDASWSVSMVQSSGGAHRELSGFGPRWFEDRIGSRITMLGEPGTTAYTAWSPVVSETSGQWRGRDRYAHGEDEPAGAAIVAARKDTATTFVALHEPFRKHHRIAAVERIAQDQQGLVVRIVPRGETGGPSPFVDYVMMRFGDNWQKAITMGRGPLQFTFSDYAHIRLTADRVEAAGGVRSFVAPVTGAVPELLVNGAKQGATVTRGWLVTGEANVPSVPPQAAEDKRTAGPIAARWLPGSAVCLPTGGQVSRTVRLRNAGLVSISVRIMLNGSAGLICDPAAIDLKNFAPGEERDVPVRFAASEDTANRLLAVRLISKDNAVHVQPADLTVAHGVAAKRSQVWPGDFAETIYSPRYVAKIYYMDAGATALLLDPQGLRRSASSGASYPTVVRRGVDNRGREGWISTKVPKFPYFIPVAVPGTQGEPAYLYEAGWHAHGTRSAVEHRFTEDWIVVRFRESKPGERIAFDWMPSSRRNSLENTIMGRDATLAKERKPGTVIVATPDGTVYAIEKPDDWPRRARLPREVEQISAVMVRPAGYDYGAAMLYPEGAYREGGFVTQPGDRPMAFTFCTESEFAHVAAKWRRTTIPAEATKQERSLYGAAFMPHLEKGE